VRLLLNLLWLILSGLWMAIGWMIAGVLVSITIIGIPFGLQAFKLAGYVLWPFGRTLVPSTARTGLSFLGNVIWFVLAGWWLALGHLISGALLCLTIIGIPFGIANFKIAGAALVPFGKSIVRIRDLQHVPAGAVVVGAAD
jgi:uncharacterized membrane protein YccF (DUF307 family)